MFLTFSDGTIWVQLINFAIFLAILNVVFLRPVGRAIRQRREYINGLTNDYDRYQAEASSLRTQGESLRASARREAEHLIAVGRAEISNETAQVASEYATRVSATIEAAHETVAGELRAAQAGEGNAVRELADAMLERAVAEVAA